MMCVDMIRDSLGPSLEIVRRQTIKIVVYKVSVQTRSTSWGISHWFESGILGIQGFPAIATCPLKQEPFASKNIQKHLS